MIANLEHAFDLVLGMLIAFVAWFAKRLQADQRQLERDLAAVERNLPNVYARRDDMAERFDQVLSALARIDSKLDHKADR